jgi:hypothetical protein
MRFLVLISLMFFLAACGNTPDTPAEATRDVDAEVTTGMESVTPAVEEETTSFLQTTLEAVSTTGGDITALSPEAAANNINGWITKLDQFEGTDAVVGDLANLKKELMLGEMDSAKVSGILSSLASNTRDLSDRAPGLATLADALQAGSDKLAGR